jgi:hypothetical protein
MTSKMTSKMTSISLISVSLVPVPVSLGLDDGGLPLFRGRPRSGHGLLKVDLAPNVARG